MTDVLDEIFEQGERIHGLLESAPTELSALAPWAKKLNKGQIRRVVFTGMGSSFDAAHPAALYLLQRGIDAVVVESSELYYDYRPLLDKNTLLIAVSQSGQSVEVVKVVESVAGTVPIIGVTNYPDSPLAQHSNAQLYMHAGEESAVSTKTYTCTLAVMHMLARALAGSDPEIDRLHRVADAISADLHAWRKQADDLVEQTEPNRFIMFLGRGPSRGSASCAALITKETAKTPTEFIVGGQFRHGHMEVVGEGITTVIFAGSGPVRNVTLTLAEDLGKLAGETVVIGQLDRHVHDVTHVPLNGNNWDQWTLPIGEIIPIQFFAARLAAARGLEVGKFFYGGKVTTTE
jgi:glutamine---fructose-6-phosphate transaminase (isomerizing)